MVGMCDLVKTGKFFGLCSGVSSVKYRLKDI